MPAEQPGSCPPTLVWGAISGQRGARSAGWAGVSNCRSSSYPPGVGPSICQTVVRWDHRFPSSDLPDLRIPGGYGQLHSVVRPCAGSKMPQFSASKASEVFRSWKTPSSYIRSMYVYRARTVSQVVFLGVGARAVTEREKSLTLTELPIYSKKGNHKN